MSGRQLPTHELLGGFSTFAATSHQAALSFPQNRRFPHLGTILFFFTKRQAWYFLLLSLSEGSLKNSFWAFSKHLDPPTHPRYSLGVWLSPQKIGIVKSFCWTITRYKLCINCDRKENVNVKFNQCKILEPGQDLSNGHEKSVEAIVLDGIVSGIARGVDSSARAACRGETRLEKPQLRFSYLDLLLGRTKVWKSDEFLEKFRGGGR